MINNDRRDGSILGFLPWSLNRILRILSMGLEKEMKRKIKTGYQRMMEVRRHKRYVLKTILQLEKKYGRMSVLDVLGEWFIKPYYGKFRIK